MSDSSEIIMFLIQMVAMFVIYVVVPAILWGVSFVVYPQNRVYMETAIKHLTGKWSGAVVTSLLQYVTLIVLVIAIEVVLFGGMFLVIMAAGGPDSSESMASSFRLFIPLLAMILSVVFFIIMSVVYGALGEGISRYSLKITRNEPALTSDAFSTFKSAVAVKRSAIAWFLVMLYYSLWCMLLIIPGIVALCSYAMTFFVLAEDDSLSASEAIAKSKSMMKGKKMEFFWLTCRFMGWSIVSMFTGGVGILWLYPYMMVSFAEFYEQVRPQNHKRFDSLEGAFA